MLLRERGAAAAITFTSLEGKFNSGGTYSSQVAKWLGTDIGSLACLLTPAAATALAVVLEEGAAFWEEWEELFNEDSPSFQLLAALEEATAHERGE